MIVVRIGGAQSAEEVWTGMKGLVDGDIGNLRELDEGKAVDWGRVDKVSYQALIECTPLAHGIGVQSGRNESNQRSRFVTEENCSCRISRSDQISNITQHSIAQSHYTQHSDTQSS